ncbi:MAG: hypothetical protein ACOZJZ_19020 [Pseudomonadota bacterium]
MTNPRSAPGAPSPSFSKRRRLHTSGAAQRGHWLWWLAPLALGLAWLAWYAAGRSDDAVARADAAASAGAWGGVSPFDVAASAPRRPASAGPARTLSPRELQLAMWQQRLERAETVLATYRDATRYPHESRPITEHPDQVRPNDPVEEETVLRRKDGQPIEGLRLRTSQERVFVQGSETVRLSVAVQDASGQFQPLRVTRAVAREMPTARTMSNLAIMPMDFNDQGRAGDVQAGDRRHGALLQPGAQGFGAGQIRVEVFFDAGGEPSGTYFDLFYTPHPPAVWQGGVREAVADGSLHFYLKADVREAGRYVVSARLDDANGKPFALLSFNDEVRAGPQEFRLSVFGKLLRDGQPAFPLTLRDVDGFLLRPDTFPDRSLMPRLVGRVHTSASYPLASFSPMEWSSEERDRYLAELSRDVEEARLRLKQLKSGS